MDYLSVLTFTSGLCVELRPPRRDNFDSWLAAFLCWQPIRPKGVQNKMTKPQSVALEDRQIANRRRNSKSTVQREAAILKVGKMLLWDRPNAFSTSGQQQTLSPAWQQVSCTLQENGAFRLFKESANTLVTCIPLSQLSRCAIQHLNSSVLEHEFCIAIYPQYATHMALGPTRPVYLALESRVCFEAWFVLLRAFTIPEFYGPEMPLEDDPSQKPGPTEPPTGNIADMFRVERMLAVRVIEAELFPRKASEESTQSRKHPKSISDISTSAGSNYYTEILLDGELRAKTAVKYNTANPSWREDLVFDNLPPVLSQISVLVKTRNPIQTDWNRVAHGTDASNQDSTLIHVLDDVELSFRDAAYGRVDISLDDLKSGIETEEWWPVLDDQNLSIGKMLINARMEDTVVLMSGEYAPMSELLHTFTNKLITNMVQIMPSKLSQLAEALLDIYQVSGTTVEWLSALIEDEIGELRVSTANRLRDTMIYANSSCGLIREQEVFFHNIEHTAIVEVNFLLQDNSLLTEALKYHMRRLGKEYLEETIGELLHEIDENNTECEVEPSRILHGSGDLERNWRKLISLTTSVWKAILTSVSQCPAELRFIFRYIRACAEACYGDILSTVTYSSVSGFLFLRFFCPAILNPKLFGLLRDRPRPRAQRTLTLILHG
ncbi:hypothetical protein AbraIFM66951_004143 [Aspergillus brasiliensis]|nr:hypothetical protein AbraIFM66951_004143 [Aspergillus brasiliensis]